MKACALLAMLVAALACGEDEVKVYLRSEPPGASISVDERQLSVRTPALVTMKRGDRVLQLLLGNYHAERFKLTVDGTGIMKPEVKVLRQVMANIDVIADDGWEVLIDKVSAKDVAGQSAMTPCTVTVSYGVHEITLKRDGFANIVKSVNVTGTTESVEVKETATPVKTSARVGSAEKPAQSKFDFANIDYVHLTAAQWNEIQAPVFKVYGNLFNDSKVEVTPGQKYVLIPHPEDTWSCAIGKGTWERTTDFMGRKSTGEVVAYMAMFFKVGKLGEMKQYHELIEGNGRLIIGAQNNQWERSGMIRVKIVKIK